MTDDRTSSAPRQSGFQKKSFTTRTLFTGTFRFVRNFPALIRAKRADRVSEQFAEKIMLAVTAVNECQYCTRFHTDLALDVGVDSEVISDILESDIGTAVGEDERPALVFAQRYAETDQDPGDEAMAELVDEYGPETTADILAFIRAIYFGNLLGNTYDAVKFASRNAVERGMKCVQRVGSEVADSLKQIRDRCPI